MACLTDERLRELSENELSPQALAELETHITDCEKCRQTLEAAGGEPAWQREVCESLATAQAEVAGLERTDGLYPAGASEPCASVDAIFQLLGPTDDPQMLGRIGPFEIVGLLGRGGMGVVFKGFDPALNRHVAIKMLLPHLATSGAARIRFAREAQAAAAVVNDCVMAIHSVAQWQGMPFLVMPYVRGASLQKRINERGSLDVREILRIGMQTATGLAAAHAQGLVHRDVKPANILLADGVERVTLTDFGLARAVDDVSLTRAGVLAGTPQYMSPEQAQGTATDARSDLFSLGSVLYAMCTGRAPFRADSTYGILRMITEDQPPPIRELNPEIPPWLCAIVDKLMAKRPEDRFESAAEVAELLRACLAHIQQPTKSPLPESLERLNVRRAPRKLLATGVASCVLLLCGLLVAPMRPDLESRDPPERAITARHTSDSMAANLSVQLVAQSAATDLSENRGAEQVDSSTDLTESTLEQVPAAKPRNPDGVTRRPTTIELLNPTRDTRPTTRAARAIKITAIYAMDADGGNVRQLATVPDYPTINSPEISPDGKWIAVDGWRTDEGLTDARVLLVNLRNRAVVNLAKGAMPSWSSDGKWIAYCKYGEARGVYVRSVEGGTERLIDRDGWGIQWAPNGLKAAYTRGNRFVIYDFIGDTRREITPPDDWPYRQIYWNCKWSSDSNQICFLARTHDGQREIGILDLTCGEPRVRIHSDNLDEFNPDIAWHPDGSLITIPRKSLPGEPGQIYGFNPNRLGPLTPLKGQPADRSNSGMCWSPDGKTLIFLSRR